MSNIKKSFIFKIIFAGNGNIGKTSIIIRYCNNTFKENYRATIGSNFSTKDVELEEYPNHYIKLQIWDLAGEPHFSFVRPPFYRGASGACVIFDLTRRSTYDDIIYWIEEMRNVIGMKPTIIVGNKNDLIDLRAVEYDEAKHFAESINCDYMETSAKTGENIDEMFKEICRKILGDWEQKEAIKKEEKRSIPGLQEKEYKLLEQIERKCTELESTLTKKLATIPSKSENVLRFLITGDEELQKPLISQLFRIEGKNWHPEEDELLYTSSRYRMVIGSTEHEFDIYILSDLPRLNQNKENFFSLCKQSDGIIIFFDPNDQRSFGTASSTGISLREKFRDLEIIISSGTEDNPLLYQHYAELYEQYQIIFYDVYESVVSSLLINILRRQKKADSEKKYMKIELKKLQNQLKSQKADPEKILEE